MLTIFEQGNDQNSYLGTQRKHLPMWSAYDYESKWTHENKAEKLRVPGLRIMKHWASREDMSKRKATQEKSRHVVPHS